MISFSHVVHYHIYQYLSILLFETGAIQWIFGHPCGYFWPGVEAPGHQLATVFKYTVRCFQSFTGLTHWGRVTHMCVSKQTILGSDNDLSADRRQTIIWTNAGILLIDPLGTNFSEILIEIYTFSFKKKHLKMSSRKWRQFCLGINMLNDCNLNTMIKRKHILYVWFENTPYFWIVYGRLVIQCTDTTNKLHPYRIYEYIILQNCINIFCGYPKHIANTE